MNLIPVVYDKNSNGCDIYSKLLESRIIFITGTIDDNLAISVVAQLLYLDSLSHNDIYLYINSAGGNVSSGMAIYDTMKLVKSDVCTVGMGMVASMGAFLLSSGTFGKRYAEENTEIMIHQILSGVEGQTSDLKNTTDRIIILQNKLNKILAKNTKKTLKKIESVIEKDYYMTTGDAIEFGLIDKILK